MSILKKFAAAAALGGLLSTGIAAGAQAQQQQRVDPVTALSQSPACVPFANATRAGVTFDTPEEHQYDALLNKYATELEGYSNWQSLKTRLNQLRFAAFGVCAYNHGSEDPPIVLDNTSGTIDINLHQQTPWGSTLTSVQDAEASLDVNLHYTIYNLSGPQGLARGMVTPRIEPETAAFINTVIEANAHAEAILFTFERGIETGNLDDLATIIYDNSPVISDQISDLYLKAMEGPLSDADKTGFRQAVLNTYLTDPRVRMTMVGSILLEANRMLRSGANVSQLYNQTPPETGILQVMTQRFGDDVAGMQIDGQPLLTGYRAHWAAQQNDQAAEMLTSFQRFREQMEAMMEQLRQQHAQPPAVDGDQAAPAPAPAMPQP